MNGWIVLSMGMAKADNSPLPQFENESSMRQPMQTPLLADGTLPEIVP